MTTRIQIARIARLSVLALPWLVAVAHAAPQGEITVIPLGGATVKSGVQTLSFRLSAANQGQAVQPLVFIAAQPSVEVAPAPPEVVEPNAPKQLRQVPATISIEVDGRKLPDFVLSPEPSAYVINVATIRGNAEFAKHRLGAKLHLKSEAATVSMVVLGMPDARLLDTKDAEKTEGPLSSFAREAKQADVRKYFEAMALEIAGDQDAALAAYRALCDSKTGDVGRFARRGRRMLEYQTRERKLSGNFLEHYRWALQLQFAGLYRPAFDEFEECRIIHPPHDEAQYRAGECQSLMNGDLMKILAYMDRTEADAPPAPQTRFDLIVVVVATRKGRDPLSREELSAISDQCLITQKMIAAATANAIKLEFTIPVAPNAAAVELTPYDGGVMGPAAQRVDRSAQFDGIITVLPRLDSEDASKVSFTTDGAGGAAMATVFHDGHWNALTDAVYRILRAAALTTGGGAGLPPIEHALVAGHEPSPGVGFSVCSALRYSVPRNALLGLGFTGETVDEAALQLWRLFADAGGDKDVWQAPFSSRDGDAGQTVVVDGARIAAGEALNGQLPPSFRATNWVYVPSDQIAQFRIDSACEVAVWVNERRVVNGTFVAGAKRGERSIFAGVALERGWNRFDVNCRAAGSGDPPSFAAWLLTTDGRPIPGLAQSHTLPESHVVVADWKVADGSEHYRWDQVRYDWQRRLPVLDIGKATQIAGAKIVAHLDARDGCIAVEIPGRSDGAGYRKPPSGWNAESDRDVTFNNVMDWRREWCMGVPCDDGRQLLFARPAAIEAIIHCLKEADGAENAFNGRVVADRLLGRVVVPAPEFDRELIVFDVQIGAPATWPADEEDLLTPFGPFIPNSISIEPVGPPKPHVAD